MTSDHLRLLERLETVWHKPWLVSGLIQQGLKRYRQGKPLQDAMAIGGCGDQHTWLVIADGVGSQPRSHHGSKLACAAVGCYLDKNLSAGAIANRALITEAFGAAHDAIATAAKNDKQPIETYSSTLAVVLISGDLLVAGSIGDSAIVAYTRHADGDGFKTRLTPFCSTPQPPIDATYAITHPQWLKAMTVRESRSPHIAAIILATDGANSFFMEDGEDGASPYDTLYLDAVGPAIDKLTPRIISNFLAEYREKNNADKDDDRTIILAWRLDEKGPPRA